MAHDAQHPVHRSYCVALDARRLVGNRRGVGSYVSSLVRCLPDAAGDMRFLLLVDRPLAPELVPGGCRVVGVGRRANGQSQSVSGFGAKLYSLFWTNVLVPGVLRRERVDLYHGTNIAVPLGGESTCVCTIHDLVSMRVPGTFSRFFEVYQKVSVPAAARRAAHVIAVSESTKRDVVSLLRVPSQKVTTIYHGVDKGFAPVRDAARLARVKERYELPARFVVYVGAVERQKRLEPFLAAAAELLLRGLADGIVLAGEEGRGADEVRRAAAELRISERVRFLGYVPQESLASLYSLASCAVYPSWYEGFGMPVLEAMACGTPVVTCNASSLPEVGGDVALLVPPGDVQAMKKSLELLLGNEQYRAERSSLGLARAKLFSWEACAKAHVAVYRRLLLEAGTCAT